MVTRFIDYIRAAWGRFWCRTITAPSTPKTKPRRRPADAASGEYYFKEAILDQLDLYFRYIKRMRAADPDSYALYRQIGAHICPSTNKASMATLDTWWKANRPAFGCVAYAIGSDSERKEDQSGRLLPKFVYFRKYEAGHAPADVQRTNFGDVYVCTVYWDKINDPKIRRGSPTEFAVAVSPEGDVIVLRQLLASRQRIVAKRGRQRGQAFTIPQRNWGIPDFFKQWASEKGVKSAEDLLREAFIGCANFYRAATQTSTRVEASKAGAVAAFAVDISRTPYFFKDRNITIGESGHRRRIFHSVKEHQRELKSGKIVTIPLHYRGERDFVWNGYAVKISVPGVHQIDISTFDVGAIDEDKIAAGTKTTDLPGLGNMLRDALDRDRAA